MGERIQGIPTGLLSALGIVGSHGRSIQELSESMAPVINAEKYYLATKAEQVTQNAAVAAVGTGAAITVPAGEYWYPHVMSGHLVTAVANWSMRLIMQPNGLIAMTVGHGRGDATVEQAGVIAFSEQLGILLPPGTVCRAQNGAVIAANTIWLTMWITRLRF